MSKSRSTTIGAAPRLSARSGLSACLVVAAIAAPFVLDGYQTFQITMVFTLSIVLLGLIILTGFNGQVSLGHGAFFAIGAYTAAILLNGTDIPYWATIPIAGLVSLGVGFLFGLPALRLEGHYLALATFALAIATPQILKNKHLEEWTGGVQGILLDKPEPPAWVPLDADQWLYFFCLFVMAVLFLVAWNLMRGKIGRAIIAIRDQPIAAASMGIDTAMYKSLTFGISAMYTGIGGALSALVTQFVAPDSFVILLSITFVVGIVIGGIRSLAGAVFGALFIQFVPNFADQISKAAPGIVFGSVLIGCIYLMPNGAAGIVQSLGERWRKLKQK